MEAIIFRIDKKTKQQLKSESALAGKSMTQFIGDILTAFLRDKKEG